MFAEPLYHTYRRLRTLQTHRISAMPIAILMPHSACNCRCVMCDIWKDNKNLKQLTEADIASLLNSLNKLGTRMVLMSGGEALLNPRFFELCAMLKRKKIRISLLSTGLTISHHADNLLRWVDDIIVSLDGDEETHDRIRNIPGAFSKLKAGIDALKMRRPGYPITARTVIHRLNFRIWPAIIETARSLGVDQISFLPADTTSTAFNRQQAWEAARQFEVLPSAEELPVLEEVTDHIISTYAEAFTNGFIAESPEKIRGILGHYEAAHGLKPYPAKKCNAPWVSAVIEADGAVKPCFFHAAVGNIREQSLETILNSAQALQFRKELNMEKDATCRRCVCCLHLSPTAKLS